MTVNLTPEDEQRIALLIENLTKLDAGESDQCPHCGKKIEAMQEVGRCVYLMPCGCRLWQGQIPPAWKDRERSGK